MLEDHADDISFVELNAYLTDCRCVRIALTAFGAGLLDGPSSKLVLSYLDQECWRSFRVELGFGEQKSLLRRAARALAPACTFVGCPDWSAPIVQIGPGPPDAAVAMEAQRAILRLESVMNGLLLRLKRSSGLT